MELYRNSPKESLGKIPVEIFFANFSMCLHHSVSAFYIYSTCRLNVFLFISHLQVVLLIQNGIVICYLYAIFIIFLNNILGF